MSSLGGKLSFGFSKVIKKTNLLKSNTENTSVAKNVQLIDSIEGSELKVLGKNAEDDEPKELVIPLTDEQKSRPIAKLIETRRNQRNNKNEDTNQEMAPIGANGNSGEQPPQEETLEQRAAREILEDLRNNENATESKILELPLHPDELPLNGASESTIDDYDRIPIADFGKAMLRGMGWKEEKKDEKEDPTKFDVFVRPKGLGLGADKVVKKQKLLVNPAPNETLEIKKGACIKILAGKHKNLYGMIEGFDDGGGRLIVKLAIGGLKVLMNEFMCQPVPKQEYAKYAKILNSEKYDEYKNDEGKKPGEVAVKQERKSRSPPSPRRREKSKSPSTSRARDRDRSRSPDRHSSKSHKSSNVERSRDRRRSRDRSPHYSRKEERERGNRSSDSEDDKTCNRKYNEKHRRSRSHEKHKKRRSSSNSSDRHSSKKKSSKKSSKSRSRKYSSDEEKVHKKKYKRSKHHRDRS